MSSESTFETPADLKIILLGDSAVGKSKLIERFLLNDFVPHQLSTYALTLYRHQTAHPSKPGKKITVEFWDTAGQERFHSMHPSYYISAHACILCFDMTRKITYKNLDTWYDQLTAYRGTTVPIVVVANKVDMDPSRARKSFGFVERRREERAESRGGGGVEGGGVDMPLFLCSASDGTNVVAAFQEAVRRAVLFKENGEVGGTFADEILSFIREEEKGGGLFSRERKEPVVDSVENLEDKFGSAFTLRESSQSLADKDRKLYASHALDSDDEDELMTAKTLARVKDMRKANAISS
ncbi:Rab-like protein 2A [Podochytrium sp. JEL0797]|nr:Rab-like protein 2A [Podochytrium sp. JEL0797]